LLVGATEARRCADGQFRCRTNYRCIMTWELCNGRDDCRDNSDEDPGVCPECHPTGKPLVTPANVGGGYVFTVSACLSVCSLQDNSKSCYDDFLRGWTSISRLDFGGNPDHEEFLE